MSTRSLLFGNETGNQSHAIPARHEITTWIHGKSLSRLARLFPGRFPGFAEGQQDNGCRTIKQPPESRTVTSREKGGFNNQAQGAITQYGHSKACGGRTELPEENVRGALRNHPGELFHYQERRRNPALQPHPSSGSTVTLNSSIRISAFLPSPSR